MFVEMVEAQLDAFPRRLDARLEVAEHNEAVRQHLIRMITAILGERDDLRTRLATLTPVVRGNLRSVLGRDEVDRDAIVAVLLVDGSEEPAKWTDVIDILATDPEMRRTILRLLFDIDAPGRGYD